MHDLPRRADAREFATARHCDHAHRLIALVRRDQLRAILRDGQVVDAGASRNAPHHLPGRDVDLHDVAGLVAGHVYRAAVRRGLRPGRRTGRVTCGRRGHAMPRHVVRAAARGHRRALHAHLLALRQQKVPADLERGDIDLHQQVVHHACRVVLRALGVQAGAVRHGAGLDARQLHHVVHTHHAHVAWHHRAVQVEVHHEREVTFGRDLRGRREVAERHPAHDRVVARAQLPETAVRRAMRRGHVVELTVRRHGQAMRTIRIGGAQPDGYACLHRRAIRTERDDGDLVGSLRCDGDRIGARWPH